MGIEYGISIAELQIMPELDIGISMELQIILELDMGISIVKLQIMLELDMGISMEEL